MTPAEIRLLKEHVTQKDINNFVDYMNNWMKATKQPDKNLKGILCDLTSEKVEPDLQMKYLLGTILDWFAYGN